MMLTDQEYQKQSFLTDLTEPIYKLGKSVSALKGGRDIYIFVSLIFI